MNEAVVKTGPAGRTGGRITRIAAAALKGGVLAALLGFLVLVALRTRVESLPVPSVLEPGLTRISVPQRWGDGLFRFEVEGQFERAVVAGREVFARSSIGHARPDGRGAFRIPVQRGDDLVVAVEPVSDGASPERLVRLGLRRIVLPGGWGLLVAVVLFTAFVTVRGRVARDTSLLAEVAMVVVSLLVGTLLTGGVLELTDRRKAEEGWRLFPPGLSRQTLIYPEVTPGIRPGWTQFVISSDGIRAPERDVKNWGVTTSVLCIGASTTECLYLDEGRHWPALVEARLRSGLSTPVWVGNAGRSGFSTSRLEGVAEAYVPLVRPGWVVLLTGFNEGIVPETGLARRSRAGGATGLWGGTALGRLVQTVLFEQKVPSPNDQVMGEDNLWYINARKKRRESWGTVSDRGWQALDLGPFERSLHQVATVAAQGGAGLVLCTQPTAYDAKMDPALEARLWMMGPYTPRSKRERMERINDRIRTVARDLDAPLVDLDRLLPRTAEVFYDDCHFTERGAERVAEEISRVLLAIPGFGQRGTADSRVR